MCVCVRARALVHVCVPFWNRYYTLTLQVNCTFPRKLISHCNITIIQKKKRSGTWKESWFSIFGSSIWVTKIIIFIAIAIRVKMTKHRNNHFHSDLDAIIYPNRIPKRHIMIISNFDRINFIFSNVCIFTKQKRLWVQNYSCMCMYVYVYVYFT